MTPQQARRYRQRLYERLENDSYFAQEHEGFAWVMMCVDAGVAKAGLAVAFRWLRDEGLQQVYEVGHYGSITRVVKTRCRGFWAIWWCLANSDGSTLRTSDLVSPDIDEPDASVRRQICKTAVKEFQQWVMPELEAAALACTVTGGVITIASPGNRVGS